MKKESHKPIPHNYEAEQFVLGSIISDNIMYHTVFSDIHPDDFYELRHKRLANERDKTVFSHDDKSNYPLRVLALM